MNLTQTEHSEPAKHKLTPNQHRIISILNGNGTSSENSRGNRIPGDPSNPYFLELVSMGLMSGPHYDPDYPECFRPHFWLTDKGRTTASNLPAYA